jgi:hypothetical protein
MTCPRCADLCVVFAIRSLGELQKAFAVAGDNLRDGTVEEIAAESGGFEPRVPFLNVLEGASPGDYVAYRFRCTSCGELFALTAETYHGSGGSWHPERSEAIRVAAH